MKKVLVILQPRGPVMFVFDASEIEEETLTPEVRKMMENPFAAEGRILSSHAVATMSKSSLKSHSSSSSLPPPVEESLPPRPTQAAVKKSPVVDPSAIVMRSKQVQA